MALDVLFVSEEKLKSYTNLNTNLSPADLQPYVWDSQNVYMPHFLGGTYYNALKDRVRNGTLTAADEFLLEARVESRHWVQAVLPFPDQQAPSGSLPEVPELLLVADEGRSNRARALQRGQNFSLHHQVFQA